MDTSAVQLNTTPKRRKQPIIDCDVHNTLASDKVLYPYLSNRWRRHHEMLETPDKVGGYIARGMPYGARHDAWPPPVNVRAPTLTLCGNSC